MAVLAAALNTKAEPNISSLITNSLFEPYGIVVDKNGDFYVSDSGNNRLVKYRAESGTLVNLAGYKSTEGGYENAKGILARFDQPTGIVLARSGLVVADTRNHVLRYIDLNTGIVSLLAGKEHSIGSIDGQASAARFNYPLGLAADSSGNIYVADSKNNAIRVLTPANQVMTYFKSSYLNNVGEPSMIEPSSVVFDDSGTMYVANTRQNNILTLYTNELNQVAAKIFAGSYDGLGGTNDWYFATNGLLSRPMGMVWDKSLGLIVSDSGNHTIRRVYFNEEVEGYSMETFAGIPGLSGFVNGLASAGRFNKPMGIGRDSSGALLVVDALNSAIRRIQTTVPLGPVAKPSIGIVVETKDAFGDVVTKLVVVDDATYFNDQIIAIVDGEQGSDIHYTSGYAAGQLDDTVPPSPTLNDDVPKAYTSGQKEMPNQLLDLLPDFTIKARSFKEGRQPSEVARAHFRFKVAPPEIVGSNPAAFGLNNVTDNAEMWYSLDGSDPTNRPPSLKYVAGSIIRLTLKDEPRTIKVRAFKSGYAPSTIVSKVFVPGDFTPNRISFGFEPPPSSLLTEFDIESSFSYFVDELIDPGNLVSQYLMTQFSPATLDLMNAYATAFSPETERLLMTNIVNNLNDLLKTNTAFYTPPRFANVNVSDEAWQLLELNPQGSSLVRLNRLLLEDTYSEIVMSMPPDARLEATSEFKGTAGRKFYAPVTLTLVPGQKIYSLQFNVSVTNVDYNPPVADAVEFHSMLLEKIEDVYRTIPPMMYNDTLPPNGPFQDLLFTNHLATEHDALIGVGWLERNGATNLYNTLKQDLITYSMAHDLLYLSSGGSVVVGAYAFMVPATATNGQQFPIEISRASATDDGVSGDVYISMPKDDNRTALTAKTNVVVDSQPYLVGDASPFHWLNTGDFGDHYLMNNDVLQVFQSAVYGLNTPPKDSDLYDAMDSCCDVAAAIYDGSDYSIDNVHFGDGNLDVGDVFVTFRRSLDPKLQWYERFYTNGVRQSRPTINRFPARASMAAEIETKQTSVAAAAVENGAEAPFVAVEAQDVVLSSTGAKAGAVVDIPIRATVMGAFPIRVMMQGISVEALDGSPALDRAVAFTPSSSFGQPAVSQTSRLSSYSCAWLDAGVYGIKGKGLIGTLHVTLPPGITPSSAYRIHFNHFSSSPNGLSIYPQNIRDGLLLASDRSSSSSGDAIPDSWRLRYFGSKSNVLAEALADADGDGVPNWAEFKGGTNPTDVKSLLKLAAARKGSSSDGQPQGVTLSWPSVSGKRYVIEYESSFGTQQWVVLASDMPGTGGMLSYTDDQAAAAPRFYRVRVQE